MPTFAELAEKLDSEDMLGWLRCFSDDVRRGESRTRDYLAEATWLERGWSGIVCLGMGGSGSGGDHLAQLAIEEGTLPVVSLHDMMIPKWVDNNWLTIATSHSGMTQETIDATQQVIERDLPIIAITSGGALQAMLNDVEKHLIIPIEGGRPPRTCFGEILAAMVTIGRHTGILGDDSSTTEVRHAWLSQEMDDHDIVNNGRNDVASLARTIAGAPIATLASTSLAPSAYRFRCQVNENAGTFVRNTVLPEAHHNEIVAWGEGNEDIPQQAVLFFEQLGQSEVMQRRIDWTIERGIQSPCMWRLLLEGETLYDRYLHGAIISDWLSFAIALLRGKDPSAIDPILELKAYLGSDVP